MNDIRRVLISIAVLAGALIMGLVFHSVLKFIVLRRHSQKPFAIRGIPLQIGHLSGPIQAAAPAAFAIVVLPFLWLPASVIELCDHLAWIWLLGSFGYLAICLVALSRDMLMSRYEITARDNLKARRMYTQIRLLERVLIAIIVLITFAVVLMTFARVRQLGVSILASAGLAGLIVGFAAQRSLGLLLAGIQIATTQPIRIDDVVIVEGEWGHVEEITLTYVVINIWDERRLVVPITYFLDKPFQNWTRTSSSLIGAVFIYADYGLPVEEVRGELDRILNGSGLWDRRVSVLQVTDASERAIQLRALVSARNSSDTWDLRCLVREKLIDYIRMRFPESLPRFRVEVEEPSRIPGDVDDRRAVAH